MSGLTPRRTAWQEERAAIRRERERERAVAEERHRLDRAARTVPRPDGAPVVPSCGYHSGVRGKACTCATPQLFDCDHCSALVVHAKKPGIGYVCDSCVAADDGYGP